MPQFRKKPVVIEARQLPKPYDNPEANAEFNAIAVWAGAESVDDAADGVCILINDACGQLKALPGDFVIKSAKGNFYPCKPDIFEVTYEAV